MCQVDLKEFDSGRFDRGACRAKEFLWRIVSHFIFEPSWLHAPRLKRILLRAFGADIAKGVVIKPSVKITFPWRLSVGRYSWLGEECWLLNLAHIAVGANCCISQRAFLCTGSHDYTSPSFDLLTAGITVEDGAWIGACAFVGPGVTVGEGAVVTAASVVTHSLPGMKICSGSPCEAIKDRVFVERARPAERGGP